MFMCDRDKERVKLVGRKGVCLCMCVPSVDAILCLPVRHQAVMQRFKARLLALHNSHH